MTAEGDAAAPPEAHAPRSRGTGLLGSLTGTSAGRILRDFATYLPTQAIPAIAGFLVLPVLARKLEPTDLGVLAIMQTLISLGWTATGSWLVAAIVRELPAHRVRGDLGGFSHTLRRGVAAAAVALGVFAGILALAGAGSSAIGANFPLVVAATAGLVAQNIAVSLFAASLRPRAYAVVEVSARVGGIGLGVALVFAGHGVGGYLAGLAAASIVVGLVGLGFAWPRHAAPPQEPPALAPWLRYGVPASMAAILVWALAFVDRYILAAIKNAGAVGIYTMGNALGDRLVMVPMFAFAAAATPLLVTAFEAHGRREVERLMRTYTRIILVVSLPCVAYVAAAGHDLVTVIAGINYFRYGEAATVAPIVAVGSLLFALAGLANTGLAVAKRTKYLMASSAVGLGTNVVANAALIPAFGVLGAAIATPLSNAVYLAATYHWARAYATWRFPWQTLARATLAAAAGYAAAVVVAGTIPEHLPLERALTAAVVGAPAYLAALYLLGERRRATTPS